MTIGQFKKYIEENNLPDEMKIGLVDTTTDDMDDLNYGISEKHLMVEDCVDPVTDETQGKALFITFENKLNAEPI